VSPTITASSVPAFESAALTTSGSGLVASTSSFVVHASTTSSDPDRVDEVLGVLLDRRAREDDGVTASLQRDDEVVRTDEGRHLVDHLLELLLPLVAHVVADLPLDRLAGNGGDVLVAAHADVTVQMTQCEDDVVFPERPVPGKRLLVAGVDQRPVDVEERCARYEVAAFVFAACCSCLPFRELLDQLLVERRDVVGLAARDEPLVDVHFLVDPVAARVADVGLQRRERRQRASAHDAGLDQRPRRVADRADRLALLEEVAHELRRVLVLRRLSGLPTPPGSTSAS
jgi:hypothetical protein